MNQGGNQEQSESFCPQTSRVQFRSFESDPNGPGTGLAISAPGTGLADLQRLLLPLPDEPTQPLSFTIYIYLFFYNIKYFWVSKNCIWTTWLILDPICVCVMTAEPVLHLCFLETTITVDHYVSVAVEKWKEEK